MMIRLFSLGLLLSLLPAQQPLHPPVAPGVPGGPQGERIEMIKMWKLTESLDLSEEQAQKFFPRYNSLVKELEDLGKQQRDLMKGMGEMLKEGKKVNEKELDRTVKQVTEIEKRKIDKKQQFVEGLGDILTPDQRAKYIVFEARFKRELRERIGVAPQPGRPKTRAFRKKSKRWR